jgi:hypothetical protein
MLLASQALVALLSTWVWVRSVHEAVPERPSTFLPNPSASART